MIILEFLPVLSSPRHLRLHLLEDFSRNYGLVAVFHEILRKLAVVRRYLLCQEINRVVFLQEQVSAVFLVLQDVSNALIIPVAFKHCAAGSGLIAVHPFFGQHSGDVFRGIAVKVIPEDPLNNLCFLRHDHEGTFWRTVVTKEPVDSGAHLAFLVVVAHADLYILADRG